ncbi:MAG TPA: S53 family peptidase [Candidatus Acidoferrales bacterium]|nr:S53 family peptidase [Candidatus Acidoferrales bacterium]
MKKLSIAALAGVLVASCSGGHGSSLIPSAPSVRTETAVPNGWAATATRGVKPVRGDDAGEFASAATRSAHTIARSIPVRVGLALRNVPQLQAAIASHQIVSRGEFLARYAPTSTNAEAVASYLRSQGVRKVAVTPDRLLVAGEGQPEQLEPAFHTSIHAFSGANGPEYANVKPALVPERFSGIVSGVLGLNSTAKLAFTPSPCFPTNPAPSGTPCLRDFGPQEMQTFYHVANTPAASQTTVAIMAEGNVSQAVADLRYAEQQNGLPQVPASIVQVGMASSDTSGLDEWDLDSQASTGLAGTVKHLYFYATTSLTDSDVANEYDRWVTDDKAQLGNSSFGECEYSANLDGAMAVDDEILMEAAAQGQTMFASTGDNGSACPVVAANGAPASGLPMVNYPASSPYVVGVGGTTLASNNDDTYLGELAWNAGGGGLSQFENSPKYMQKVQIVGGSAAEANLRGLPDIAMAADPNSGGFNVYTVQPLQTATGPCGEPCAVGGTSESSPLAMGAYARMQTAHHNALGFAGVRLYDIYIANSSASSTPTGPPPTQTVDGYHDVITGSNGAYAALPGFDYTTGMGTLDIALTNQFIGQ